MHIHFNEYGIKPVERETKERRWNSLHPSKSNLLSSSLVSFNSRGSELSAEEFKRLVNALCHEFGDGKSYENILSQCISDTHCKNEENATSVTLTDGTFSLSVQKSGLWLAKVLDYEHYEQAMQRIVQGLKILTENAFFTHVTGVFAVQDGNTEIYFHTVFVSKENFFYKAYHSAYDTIDCYAKAKGPNGDFFVFRYETPIHFSAVEFVSPREPPFENGSFELMLGDEGKESAPFVIMRTKELKDNFYIIKVGLSGSSHSLRIAQWRSPLCIVFTAKTLQEALSKLHHMITNRGLAFVNYETFKEAVINANVE